MPRKTTRPAGADFTPPRNSKNRIPLRITDTTLRDAHQSLWATRMRTKDMLGILDVMDSVGFYSLEVWGGATFDVCLRFLRENPWERLRQIKAKAKKTPLQMLLRGQNILGYKNYPDDLLDRFIALACKNGVDIFRIFDALNDTRNLEQAVKAVKRYGGHAQGTICYTISPVHTVEEFVRIAKEQVAMGIDSLCIKDMAGILSPISAEKVVSALVENIEVPIQIHTHDTSGMGTATYVEAVRAGAGAIDCAISVVSSFSSQPPVETMLSIFEEMPYHANLDGDALRKMCRYFTEVAPKRQLAYQPINPIDPDILVHHIPGGMISNLRSQLQQQDSLNRLDEVLAEVPKVRADLGYPPLVTPTSQIIGVQAVMNVLSGQRYSLVPLEIKEYVKGLYGRSPAPIAPDIRKKILGDEPPIEHRPADLLEPILPKVTHDIPADYIKGEEDIISFCIFPEPAMEYFKWRELPTEERPSPPADLEEKKKEAAPIPEGSAPMPAPAHPFLTPHDYLELQGLAARISDLHISEFTIRRQDLALSIKSSGMVATAHPPAPPAPAAAASPKATSKPAAAAAEKDKAPGNDTINAPLNGAFYLSPGPGKPQFAKEGDVVAIHTPVCMVEAMKLFNRIKAPCKCKVLKFLVAHGAPVKKDQPLVSIEKV
ncbi:MAG: pyruvate carboxylase subunit B [Verrucomicrobiota bacterium]|nr:pyruvate carboxylase subunit B [Verrucomicrobiota bacterium]